MSDDHAQRFASIERLYGTAAVSQLDTMHLCVVGLGGVGSWAAEAAARTGVGRITLIDHDTVHASNINRQLPALTANIGRKKITVMAERILGINPHCTCTVIDDYVTSENMADYLSREYAYDYVIDAIDSIKFKAAMIYHCRRNKIPIVTVGGAGGLTDPAMVQVKDLSRTFNDPLAAKVRSRLRGEYNFPKNLQRRFGVECVFSGQQPVYPRADGGVGHEKPGIHGISLDCRFGYGSAVFVTATFGFVAVSRAVNKTLARRARANDLS